MKKILTPKEKADRLRQLHHAEKMLVLPNIWDTLGAALLESLEYPAIATASASVAFTNGYNDGENIPFEELLVLLGKITASVNIPVTADFESGYATDSGKLQDNVRRLMEAGIVGINLEDTNPQTGELWSMEEQCHRIRLIRQVAVELGIPLFINARTDVLIHGQKIVSNDSKLTEITERGLAFKEAGADCFFPIGIKQEDDIVKLVAQLKMPINILALPGVPDLARLHSMGVARVSLGPAFLKIAIQAMKNLAVNLSNGKGLSEITGNEITTDYLRNLTLKNY